MMTFYSLDSNNSLYLFENEEELNSTAQPFGFHCYDEDEDEEYDEDEDEEHDLAGQYLVFDEEGYIYDWQRSSDDPDRYNWLRTDRTNSHALRTIRVKYGRLLADTGSPVEIDSRDEGRFLVGGKSGEWGWLTRKPHQKQPSPIRQLAYPCRRSQYGKWSPKFDLLLSEEKWHRVHRILEEYASEHWARRRNGLIWLFVACVCAGGMIYSLAWYWGILIIHVFILILWLFLIGREQTDYEEWIWVAKRLTDACHEDLELLRFARKNEVFEFNESGAFK
jgi:hypothetical protein